MRRIIGAVLIVLLLMGMAGLGAWQLLGRSGGAAFLEMLRRSAEARASPPT